MCFKGCIRGIIYWIIRILKTIASFLLCPKGYLERFVIWIGMGIAYRLNGPEGILIMKWVRDSWTLKKIIWLSWKLRILWLIFIILGLVEKPIMRFIKNHVPDDLADELAEEILELVVNIIIMCNDLFPNFHDKIKDFKATFQFRGSTEKPFKKSIAIVARFDRGKVTVEEPEEPIPEDKPDVVTVIFSNGKAILNYLIAAKKDISRLILNNEVVPWGNVNYVLRFQYIANDFIRLLKGVN